MSIEEKIDIDLFKVVTRAIATSDHLDIMADQLAQLLVSALDIKACSVFVLNPANQELERLSSFGLSHEYLNKGPVLSQRSIGDTLRGGNPVVIRDIAETDRLQYPEAARKEGIGAIVSLPIPFRHRIIGALRVYDSEPWDISERDLDSLMLFAESVGLAMMCTQLLNALQGVKEVVEDVQAFAGDTSTG